VCGLVGGELLRGGGRSCGFGRERGRGGSRLVRGRVERRVGDEMETFFGSNLWLGGMPLSMRFRRLYNLSLHLSCMVTEISALGGGKGGAHGRGGVVCGHGRKNCRGSVGMFLLTLVCSLMWGDQWVWQHDPSGVAVTSWRVQNSYCTCSSGYRGYNIFMLA
jgi:hypothetical protein